jgi:glycerol-3-phosphate dehydrogenase
MMTRGWRDALWAELERPWDIIVIGGGITGAGILREAAVSGLRTLLLEARDFASGASSRSSKLVHGGLRYLRNGQLRITLDSVRERKRLLHDLDGLVSPLDFVWLGLEGDGIRLGTFGLGLAIYDLLGLRWDHRREQSAALADHFPFLNKELLLGGYRYGDARTDDARLVLRVIGEGMRLGGAPLNYAPVVRLLRRENGRVSGVAVRDVSPGGGERTAEVQAEVVISATGSSADRLRGQLGRKPRLRKLRGSHLVFPRARFPVNNALSFAHPHDRRPVMAIPWEGITLFGTTDVDHEDRPADTPGEETSIAPEEVSYLMAAAAHAFPGLSLTLDDVQTTFSGLRAVVDTGKKNPSKESREHVLWNEDGLLTVTGGKLTTFRLMARQALRAVRSQLPGRGTRRRPTPLLAAEEVEELASLEPSLQLRLLGRYGPAAAQVVAAAREGELAPICSGACPATWAELRWAARSEGVIHLEDLLLRRLRLGLLLPEGGLPLVEEIRRIAQPELGWDDDRWQEEVAAYRSRWCSSYGPPAV